MSAMAEVVLGDGKKGLRSYQPYKYVSRKRAYGQSFQSDKQRRWFFANLKDGKIDPGVPHRTGKTQRGWQFKPMNKGAGFVIENQEPGAFFTRHETGQARLNALAGWKKTGAILKQVLPSAIKAAQAAVKAYLKTK